MLTFFVIFTFSGTTFAESNWTFKKVADDDDFVLSNGVMKTVIGRTNVIPTVLEVKKHGNLEIVIFHKFTSGTSLMLVENYGAIFNTKTKKFIDDHPYSYIILSEVKDPSIVAQPQWTFESDSVSIKLDTIDLDVTIPAN